MLSHVANLCGIDSDRIEGVFPCTPLQEGLLALTAKDGQACVARHTLELSRSIEEARFSQGVGAGSGNHADPSYSHRRPPWTGARASYNEREVDVAVRRDHGEC